MTVKLNYKTCYPYYDGGYATVTAIIATILMITVFSRYCCFSYSSEYQDDFSLTVHAVTAVIAVMT